MNKSDIRIVKRAIPKQKPARGDVLGFGQIFTDHMFLMDYKAGAGWYDPRIVPNEKILLDPAAMVFHYGQATFEGMKAYRGRNGDIVLFRPKMNFQRMNRSNARMCIPEIDGDFALGALKALLDIDRGWVPSDENTSLYIRPFVIATDPYVGVRPSDTYMFIIILSPVGAYYPEGLAPVKIYVENEYVRAVRGGIGFAKAAANYAASLKAQDKAKKLGYTQVLWLDGLERKYIEEVGTMNVFFKIGGKIVTPSLSGSILPGITRDSVMLLLKKFGYELEERPISIDEVSDAYERGLLEEAFGTGTAAVISPIGELILEDKALKLSGGKIGELSQKLYDTLTEIQYGGDDGGLDWTEKI